MAKKKKPSEPKPRHVWEINPKSRVKKSAKIYKKSRDRKIKKDWTDDLSWFQE